MLGLCPVAAVSTYSEYDMIHTVYVNDCCKTCCIYYCDSCIHDWIWLCIKTARIKNSKTLKNVRDRNGHPNHQKVMKQVTMYKIPHTHVTTEAMTTAHSATGTSNALLCAMYDVVNFY